MTPESFVSAEEAARILGIKRRFLLSLARQGIGGAYPLGTGSRQRNVWVFLISELMSAVKRMPVRKPTQPERLYDVNIRRSSLK